MKEDLISKFCQLLPTKHLRRSNSDYVIICTPYLRAEFGKEFVDVVYTGQQKERYTAVDFEDRYVDIMRRHIHYSVGAYKIMAPALKERFLGMRSLLKFNVFALHGTDGHRLTLTIGDSRTDEALAVLHANDYKGDVYINMIGRNLDLHTGIRVAFNISGRP